ncbi:MAG: hypothetical protein QW259_06615 [Pyrobaculum sp.]
MIDDVLYVAAVTALAAAALGTYVAMLINFSATPAPCVAAKMVLESPGSEVVVYGRFKVVEVGDYVYLSCGLYVPKTKAEILKTSGRLTVGSTPDGVLYIR